MEWMIVSGSVVTLLGLIGIIYCIAVAMKTRKAGGTDDEIRARLKRLVAINMAAFFLSAIGLMLVVVGVILA